MTTRAPLVRISGKIVELPTGDQIGGAPAGSDGATGDTGATGQAATANLLINGGPDVWQAGTSFTPTAGTRMRTADTWWALRNTHANFTVTQQTGVNNQYCIRVQRTNATSDTDAIKLAVGLETKDAAWMATALPTMCVSFYARAGSGYSASNSNLVVKAIRGTGTDENELDVYTGSSTLQTLTQAITTTMTRYSFTFTPDASTNELAIEFSFTPVGTAGANDYFEIECLQLEIGSSASSFGRRPLSHSIQMCYRYYQKSFPYSTAPAQSVNDGRQTAVWLNAASGAQVATGMVFLHSKMRAAATVTFYNPFAANAQFRNTATGTDCSSCSANVAEMSFSVNLTPPASSAVGHRCSAQWTAADANF